MTLNQPDPPLPINRRRRGARFKRERLCRFRSSLFIGLGYFSLAKLPCSLRFEVGGLIDIGEETDFGRCPPKLLLRQRARHGVVGGEERCQPLGSRTFRAEGSGFSTASPY